jgi:nitrite reductase/ring-hydroxylating ferredoxin subunit
MAPRVPHGRREGVTAERAPAADSCLRLCRLDEIPNGEAWGFSFGSGTDRREIFVLRRDGNFYAYENACPHQGTPLNFLPDRFLDRSGKLFHCTTHGAQFRIEDGFCIRGPCEGKSLRPIRVEIVGSDLVWIGA